LRSFCFYIVRFLYEICTGKVLFACFFSEKSTLAVLSSVNLQMSGWGIFSA